LDLLQVFPEIFNGVIGCPQCGDARTIGFELSTCDGSIGCAKMGEHGSDTDIGETKGIVIKGHEIQLIDGSKELFFHFFMDGCGQDEFGHCGFVDADHFVDLELHCICSKDGIVAGMDGELKGDAIDIMYLAMGMTRLRGPWLPPLQVDGMACALA